MKHSLTVPGLLFFVALLASACGDNDNSGMDASHGRFDFRCSTGTGSSDRFEVVPPFSLATDTDGFTVSVFPSTIAALDGLEVQVNFTTRGHPPTECSVGVGNGGSIGTASRVRAGDREGVALSFSPADLVHIVDFLHTFPSPGSCPDVTGVGDLAMASIDAGFAPPGPNFVALDGIAIGDSATTLPTTATELPECLRASKDTRGE